MLTNKEAIAALLPTLMISIIVPGLVMLRNRRQSFLPQLVLLFVCNLLWISTEILNFANTNARMAVHLFDLPLIAVAFSPVLLVLFCHKFYGVKVRKKLRFAALLYIIPAITTILALTGGFHRLLRSDITVIETTPYQMIDHTRGPWFWVHAAFCYLLTAYVFFLSSRKHKTLPSLYRMPSFMILAGVGVLIVSNVVSISGILHTNIDITVFGDAVCSLLLFIAIDANENSDFLLIAHSQVFNSSLDYIFVLNNREIISDANRPAMRWCAYMGISPVGRSTQELMTEIERAGGRVTGADVAGGVDISFPQEETYSMRQLPMLDENETRIGQYMTISNVTKLRGVIRELETSSYVDSLTALGNRRAYDHAMEQLEQSAVLPVSVIIGDVNGLKRVNDEYGHVQGDSMLRSIASVLSSHCPEDGTAARIGGDEFALLLPGASSAVAAWIVEKVEAELREKFAGEAIQPSIALGYATKTDPAECLKTLVMEADAQMYHVKKYDRRSSRRGPEARGTANA